ncbi:MAG: osmoprotectant NAGGN system M42 family peptidase [Halieaceae bacterium]|jgi:peptidase M42 family hydrolase|nr:osmoprotectant NAGGN system M42 family peptidase [Halieaceae bacterium]
MNIEKLPIDEAFLHKALLEMLAIPSPTGFTDELVRYVCARLDEVGVPYSLSRRGTITATLTGRQGERSRAVANHLDTIGAAVTGIHDNGRLSLKPIGTWSSRFAEGGRVTVFAGDKAYRGQVLPLLASGHAFNERIDQLPVGWDQVELRINQPVHSAEDTRALGIGEGDFVAFDSDPEWDESGYITARHLDNKAGAAAALAALKALVDNQVTPAVDLHVMFTITEEVGTGAGTSLEDRVAEFVGIDIGPVAPGQNARETGVTLCAQDTSGPFDRLLTGELRKLCRAHDINCQTDVFRYYYSDANSAIVAGHDVRHGLVTFGTDATHGYERTHRDSLYSIAALLAVYAQAELLDDHAIGSRPAA